MRVTAVTAPPGRRAKPYSEVRHRPIAIEVAPTLSFAASVGGGRAPAPRVAGKTPDNSISLNVDDVNFSLTKIAGKAGEVIEFLVTNTSGTQQSHNMVVAGPDNEYDTADDFNPSPFAIKAGETGRGAWS